MLKGYHIAILFLVLFYIMSFYILGTSNNILKGDISFFVKGFTIIPPISKMTLWFIVLTGLSVLVPFYVSSTMKDNNSTA